MPIGTNVNLNVTEKGRMQLQYRWPFVDIKMRIKKYTSYLRPTELMSRMYHSNPNINNIT